MGALPSPWVPHHAVDPLGHHLLKVVSLKKVLMRHWWLLREESQNHISLKLIQKLKKQEIFILIKWCTVSISSSYCEKWNTQSLLFRYQNRWLISANVKCFHILFTCSFYFFDFLKLGLYHNILNNVIQVIPARSETES